MHMIQYRTRRGCVSGFMRQAARRRSAAHGSGRCFGPKPVQALVAVNLRRATETPGFAPGEVLRCVKQPCRLSTKEYPSPRCEAPIYTGSDHPQRRRPPERRVRWTAVQITRRSQQKFADFAAAWGTLRTIENVYEAHGFSLPVDFELPSGGQRRAICAAMEQQLDATDPVIGQRLMRVYVDAIDDWGREGVFSPHGLGDPFNAEARAMIRALQRDGVPLDDDAKLTLGQSPPALALDRFGRLDEPRALVQHMERIEAGIAKDPAAAIGSAKELVESACKFVLADYGVEYDERRTDLVELYKLVASELKLTREAVPQSTKGSRASHKVLQNLTTVVQSLAELRNELGLGHGRTTPSPALSRHARLAANAARTVVEFLLETWHVRRDAEPNRSSSV